MKDDIEKNVQIMQKSFSFAVKKRFQLLQIL